MKEQEGSLTASQLEIMRLLWDSPAGLTVAEIWAAICLQREVSRTTVLNLVDRLEKRKWLHREKVDNLFRYQASVDRQTTEARLADDFIDEYFEGSPSSFVLSLLGSKKISKAEVQRLKALLDEQTTPPCPTKPRKNRG